MFIIDRFEGDWAVIETEDRKAFNFPRQLLPQGTREGDILNFSATVDQEATKVRRKQAAKLLDNFFE